MFAGIEVVLWIIGGFAVIAGAVALLGSNESDPGERLKESAGAAAGGGSRGIWMFVATYNTSSHALVRFVGVGKNI